MGALGRRRWTIGLWDYDQPTESIAWVAFVKPDAALKKAVSEMETYIREQLGDALV